MNKTLLHISFLATICLLSSCQKCVPVILCPYPNPQFYSAKGGDTAFLCFPNAFTPNGDGINDQFYLANHNIASFQCRIYDADGRQIYISNNPLTPWDGTVNGKRGDVGIYAVKVTAATNYGLSITLDGTISIIGGQFDGDNSQNINGNIYMELKNAQFPDQFGVNGLFDPNLSNQENLPIDQVHNCH